MDFVFAEVSIRMDVTARKKLDLQFPTVDTSSTSPSTCNSSDIYNKRRSCQTSRVSALNHEILHTTIRKFPELRRTYCDDTMEDDPIIVASSREFRKVLASLFQ